MITQAFYVSHSTFESGNPADMDILHRSRERNASAGLTGFLFRTQNHYFQVLEGNERALVNALERIRSDPRHFELQEWPLFEAEDRAFPNWSMGFAVSQSEDFLATAFWHSKPQALPDIIANLQRFAGTRFRERN